MLDLEFYEIKMKLPHKELQDLSFEYAQNQIQGSSFTSTYSISRSFTSYH